MTKIKVYEKCKKLDPKIWIASYVLISAVLLYFYPTMQVSHFEINNSTTIATLENQYRATLTQILGGAAVAIGIYFAWKNFITAQENLKTAQEGQITERFTRAVDQLGAVDKDGNPAIEIRLGGIYALERIANESDKDYWPIMEILTAYIRKNSPTEYGEETFTYEYSYAQDRNVEVKEIKMQNRISLDIHAIVTVIRRRRNFFNSGESNYLDLRGTNLREADFEGANLQGVNLKCTYLEGANFRKANLQEANLEDANLQEAIFFDANLQDTFLAGVYLRGAFLTDANLQRANLAGADFRKAFLYNTNLQDAYLGVTDFERAQLGGANLEGADFIGANLINANGLTVDQLSKAKTLCSAQIDEDLLIPLKEMYPDIFKIRSEY
jgi:Uncharacterized low-complexity proteins